jgi:hypothetical protein
MTTEEVQKMFLQNDFASIRMCRMLTFKILEVLLNKGILTSEDLGEEDIETIKRLKAIADEQVKLRQQNGKD